MRCKLNIIIPLAGEGRRFLENGFKVPKPLIKVKDKMILEWAIKSIGIKGNFIFCCKNEHIKNYNLDEKLKQIIPDCHIVKITNLTEGPVKTILEAKNLINNDEELIISDSDHYLEWDYLGFSKKIKDENIDAGVMVFPQEQQSRSLSYVKLNEDGYVIEAAEKKLISKIATVGLHYFRRGSDFVKYSTRMIEKNIRTNNEFFVTPVYNEFILDGKKVIAFPVSKMASLGTPEDVINFVNSRK